MGGGEELGYRPDEATFHDFTNTLCLPSRCLVSVLFEKHRTPVCLKTVGFFVKRDRNCALPLEGKTDGCADGRCCHTGSQK
jgi:hypothetical protein